MKKTGIAIGLMAALCGLSTRAAAQEDLRGEIQQLKQRLAELEQKLEASGGTGEDADGLGDDVQRLRDIVEEPEGSVQTTIADVAKLKKIKVSGYIQGRYEAYSTPAVALSLIHI